MQIGLRDDTDRSFGINLLIGALSKPNPELRGTAASVLDRFVC